MPSRDEDVIGRSERDHMRLDKYGEFSEPFAIYEVLPGCWVNAPGTATQEEIEAEQRLRNPPPRTPEEIAELDEWIYCTHPNRTKRD